MTQPSEDPARRSLHQAAIWVAVGCLSGTVASPAPVLDVTDGLALRLDASDRGTVDVTTTGSVARWRDTSLRGGHAVQEERARRPLYVSRGTNTPPAVRFDGREDFLAFPAIKLEDFTSFVVFLPTASSSVLLGDAANRDWIRVEPGQVKAKWRNTAAIAKGGKQVAGAVQLFSVVRQGEAARFFLNRTSAGAITTSLPFTPTHIGHKSTGGATENFFAGDMHEILVYQRVLPDAERERITAYLAAKWKVPASPGATPAAPTAGLSHAPMLGAVSETAAAIWLRTSVPCDVRVVLTASGKEAKSRALRTASVTDNTAVVRFQGLTPETAYTYTIHPDPAAPVRGVFSTFGPSQRQRVVRLGYGYGYNPGQRMKRDSIFAIMAKREPDFVLFIGDFPYTAQGKRLEIWAQNKVIRGNEDFALLTRDTPTCAVWDDHDFGPNDCDGTHPNAPEALSAFKDYWANPAYGEPRNAGIYSSFVVGDVEIFLLDGRYQSRQSDTDPTMLGPVQFRWLCDGLQDSRARYKLLVSGTPFARVKNDCWGGRFYRDEREKLFAFISSRRIPGVIGISGDIHRCDIHRLPMGKGQFFYDFTAGALARVHRYPPKQDWPETMLYSYGGEERNMFGEIDFHPASDAKTAITFRSFSGKNGLVHRFRLTPADLGLPTP